MNKEVKKKLDEIKERLLKTDVALYWYTMEGIYEENLIDEFYGDEVGGSENEDNIDDAIQHIIDIMDDEDDVNDNCLKSMYDMVMTPITSAEEIKQFEDWKNEKGFIE